MGGLVEVSKYISGRAQSAYKSMDGSFPIHFFESLENTGTLRRITRFLQIDVRFRYPTVPMYLYMYTFYIHIHVKKWSSYALLTRRRSHETLAMRTRCASGTLISSGTFLMAMQNSTILSLPLHTGGQQTTFLPSFVRTFIRSFQQTSIFRIL